MATTEFTPTAEQSNAVDLFLSGDSLAVEALAGAGKTSTLRLMADAAPDRTGIYVAFNKKIVTDAQGSFPGSVFCATAHSMAYRAVGKNYRARLDAPRVSPRQMAERLGLDLDTPIVVEVDGETLEIWAPMQAMMAKATVDRFCSSADPHLHRGHIPVFPGLDEPGEFNNHNALAPRILGMADRIWSDLQRTDRGDFRFEHSTYLKLWQLSNPRIHADFILFDEAQDASPVMRAIVEAQSHAQLVYVGDSNQAIYEWTGAVDALAQAKVTNRARLTESFRFGPEVAGAANQVLARLGAGVEVIGSGPTGTVGDVDRPDCVLGRTNAGVVEEALTRMDAGQRVAVQGGTREIEWFARSAQDLMDKGSTDHPELACFPSWEAVERYVEDDPAGADLKTMVRLVNDWGGDRLATELKRTVEPRWADVTVSTAHKAKGAEWPAVKLLADFPGADPAQVDEVSVADLRLMYVAVTRAKRALDVLPRLLTGPTRRPGLVS